MSRQFSLPLQDASYTVACSQVVQNLGVPGHMLVDRDM